MNQGLLTLDDLRNLTDAELTAGQKLGLKYFDELEMKIPREEMDIWNVLSLNTILILSDDDTGRN